MEHVKWFIVQTFDAVNSFIHTAIEIYYLQKFNEKVFETKNNPQMRCLDGAIKYAVFLLYWFSFIYGVTCDRQKSHTPHFRQTWAEEMKIW